MTTPAVATVARHLGGEGDPITFPDGLVLWRYTRPGVERAVLAWRARHDGAPCEIQWLEEARTS